MAAAKREAVRLTKSYIDKLDAPQSGYDMHWDRTVKGYGLRVSREGKKTFIAMGRVKGKLVQFTLGPYGVLTEDAARKRAQKVLQDMREGIDPRDVQKQDDAMKVTLQQVCDAYVARPGKLKASSKDTIERHVRTTFAAWAGKPIISITEDMCKARYREMLTKGLRGKGGAPGQANQAFSVLGALINYASRQYTRLYHEKQNPTLAKRRTAMTAARKLIEENAGLVFKERDKAVGFVTDPKSKRKLYPAELRKMAADADKGAAASLPLSAL